MSDRIPRRPDGVHPVVDEPGRAVAPPAPDIGDPRDAARPGATWAWWEGAAVYLVAFVVGGAITVPILAWLRGDEDLANITASIVAAVAIAGILVAWLSNSHPAWRRILAFPARGAWVREVRDSVGFGLLLYPAVVFVVGIVVTTVLQAVSGERVEAPEQVGSDLSLVGTIVTIVYAVAIAPIHEELFFRGILFRAVRDRYGLIRGFLATALGFALIHYLDAPWQDALLLMGVMFFNGIALAWWYERRGTIVAPIVAHMTFNVIGIALILALG